MDYLFERTETAGDWTYHATGGAYILDGVLCAAVKATRGRDGAQYGHWAIVVREEDIPAACAAIRKLLDLQIAQIEGDE